MIDSNLAAAEQRYSFYKDGWRIMIWVLPVLAVAFLVMAFAVAYAVSRQPEPRYFAVENGRLTPIAPVSNPYIRPGDLNQWVARAVMELYMVDFQNYRTRVTENAKYFTPEGFTDYKNTLQSSGRMKLIIDGWFVGSAVPEGAPVVVQEGVVNGRYMWKVRMPIRVDYTSKSHQIEPQHLTLTITVVRVQTWENPFGVGISQIVERPTTNTPAR